MADSPEASTVASTATTQPNDLAALTFADIVYVIRRSWKFIGGLSALAMIAVGTTVLLLPRTYTATASFVPQQPKGTLSGALGLSAQIGLSDPLGNGPQSPEYYLSLLGTREILGPVVEATYRFHEGRAAVSLSLIEILTEEKESNPKRRIDAIRILKNKKLTVRMEPKTGIIWLEVTVNSAELAKAVVDSLLFQVNKFNLESQKTQAGAERAFSERRANELGSDLLAEENRLQEFLQANQDARSSSKLAFEQDRLARRVAMRQSIYTAMVQTAEQARADEARDTPVITVIQKPELPPEPDPRGLVRKSVLAGILAVLLASLIAFVRWRLVPGEAVSDIERPPSHSM